jgi:tRNA dimethylallyltransferase
MQIDRLLIEDKIPIVVGGTNYYIESILFDMLIEKSTTSNEKKFQKDNETKKLLDNSEPCNEIEKFFIDLISSTEDSQSKNEGNNQLVLIHDSKISTEKMYEQLTLVDPQSAHHLHPNDRRKISR